MRWSLQVARFAGIPVRIHATFPLVLVWFAYQEYQTGGAAAARLVVYLLLALFGCVLLHEFGHALAARRFGIPTADITLLPIGGVARMQRMPEKPWQELIVAIAGPAVNVVIAILLLFGLGAGLSLQGLTIFSRPTAEFATSLAIINVWLVAFNLIPAFPMDGGRMLRAVLAMKLRHVRATRIAAWVGHGFCALFAIYGVLESLPMLVLLAGFVFLAGAQEARAAQLLDVAGRLRVADAMSTDVAVLPGHAVLEDAVALLLRTSQQGFPVIDDAGVVQGVLLRSDVIAAVKREGMGTAAMTVMRRGLPHVSAQAPLESAVRMMQQTGFPVLPVVDAAGCLTGLLTSDKLRELLLVHALRPGPPTPARRTQPPPLPTRDAF